MKYTPRRIVAWLEVMERIEQHDKADKMEIASAGNAGGKDFARVLRKLRDQL